LVGGVATYPISSLTVGNHPIRAIYSGDANFGGSSSGSVGQAVTQATSTTGLVSSLNPSTPGTSVTFTATVSGPGSTPTGTVQFKDAAANLGGPVSVNGSGVATLATSALTVASHPITAVYTGDANYTGSTSSVVTQVVNPAVSATVLGSSLNPSTFGQSVTLTATVTSGIGTPTGTVQFRDGVANVGAPVALNGSGVATLVTSTLSAGSHSMSAAYGGDATRAASTSNTLIQVVNPAATTTALGAHTPDPSPRGALVAATWTVGVVGPGAGTPGGTVTVSDGVDSCAAAVAAGGCSVALTTVGARTLTATYSGDANFGGSASAGTAHTVAPGASTTTITSDTPDPSVTGQSVTVTFTVTGAAGTPTGNVNVSDGGSVSCAATVAVGQCVLVFPTAGAKTLTAAYGGDLNYLSGLSTGVSHLVNAAATTTTLLTHTPDPSVAGAAVAVTWSVVPTAPGAGTPTGNVTVSDGVDSCTADATVGGCTIAALTTVGTRTLVATYAGSPNFAGSASPGVSHTVN
ncbi:MAG TPA: Ig-like domain-containing protein, partial [Gemmatimonadales bacterium]|nr:Ig-like domain-containing protein [Gemmatimonadales bacterium]